jgi:hypothetical protein
VSSLRARRAWADESVCFEPAIPQMDPPVYLRLRRVDPDTVGAQVDRAEKSKQPNPALTRVCASVIATYCVGVCEKGPDGKLRSIDPDDPDGAPPVFGERLAELLELPTDTQPTQLAIELCSKAGVQTLFVALTAWSGMDPDQRIEELRGE